MVSNSSKAALDLFHESRKWRTWKLKSFQIAKRFFLFFGPLLLLNFSGTALAQSSAAEASHEECRRIALPAPLGGVAPLEWVTSGVWTEGGTTLLASDVLKERIQRISMEGDVTPGLTTFASFSDSSLREFRLASHMREKAGGGFQVLEEYPQGQIYTFNENLLLEGEPIILSFQDLGEGSRLLAVFDWSPLTDGLVAFGDILNPEDPDDEGRSGFIYLGENGDRQIFDAFSFRTPLRNHYIGIRRHIATLGNIGYILRMDDIPFVGEIRPGRAGVRKLEYFPEDFKFSPRLVPNPEWIGVPGMGARQATAYLEQIEASAMPMGLYAWNESIFVLAKSESGPSGTTAWWMIRIDAADGRELSRARLPTEATHLTVVPGENFAFLEKGPVEPVGPIEAPYLDTRSVVLVPAKWLEEPEGGPLGENQWEAPCAEFSS